MTKMIINIQPFDRKQKLYIYQDGNLLYQEKLELDNITQRIFALSTQYGAKNITLLGSKQYNKGLVEKIQEEELEKYNKNELIFNVN